MIKQAPPGQDVPASASTILVVEDSKSLTRLLEDTLQEAGHRVRIASDGAGARSVFAKLEPNWLDPLRHDLTRALA